jgi:hypothetical protein
MLLLSLSRVVGAEYGLNIALHLAIIKYKICTSRRGT